VTRCGHDSTWICQAFSQHRFDEGADRRPLRAFVQEAIDVSARGSWVGLSTLGGGELRGPAPKKPGKARVFRKSTNVRRSDGQERKRETTLAACFDGATTKLAFELHSTLDESGRVSSVSVDNSDVSEAQRECVLRVAKTLGYRCPETKGTWSRVATSSIPPDPSGVREDFARARVESPPDPPPEAP
jgi:hypothetical protein